jgi:predicted transcriptional regulator
MLTVRLPPATKAALKALALQQDAPLWQVVEKAVAAYIATLTAAQRRLLADLANSIERR